MSARIPFWYSHQYAVPDVPVLARLATAAKAIDALGGIDWRCPGQLDSTALHGLHDAEYLQAFESGREPLASSQGLPWSPAVRDASYAMLAGQIASAQQALEQGFSINLARGFHHAVRQRGSGFCALNGLAFVAHCLPQQRILVIDCDEHGGNGTEEFAAELPNLFACSVFGTRFGCRGGPRSWAWEIPPIPERVERYFDALAEVFDVLDTIKPDLVLYQAGADCHALDPKSRLKLSSETLFDRDRRVFRELRTRRIPCSICIGGGYQSHDRVAALNVNTVLALRRETC
jgi:acetoin utilization deacetylase AcuC-like enzyme